MLVKFFVQPLINVRLVPEGAPQQEGHSDHTEGGHFPPGALVLAPHGALHLPSPVTGLASGEADGLNSRLLLDILSRFIRLGEQMMAHGERPHTADKKT